MIPAEDKIRDTITKYKNSFVGKVYDEENEDHDALMDVFGLLPQVKRENRQYWGRELGMCWQLIVTDLFRATAKNFQKGYRDGADELCDLIAGKDAIDTKYRVGSGDSGTLKKFKQYSAKLKHLGYKPVLLILRNDNLPAAMAACARGGWQIYTGDKAFGYIQTATGINLKEWFASLGPEFHLIR